MPAIRATSTENTCFVAHSVESTHHKKEVISNASTLDLIKHLGKTFYQDQCREIWNPFLVTKNHRHSNNSHPARIRQIIGVLANLSNRVIFDEIFDLFFLRFHSTEPDSCSIIANAKRNKVTFCTAWLEAGSSQPNVFVARCCNSISPAHTTYPEIIHAECESEPRQSDRLVSDVFSHLVLPPPTFHPLVVTNAPSRIRLCKRSPTSRWGSIVLRFYCLFGLCDFIDSAQIATRSQMDMQVVANQAHIVCFPPTRATLDDRATRDYYYFVFHFKSRNIHIALNGVSERERRKCAQVFRFDAACLQIERAGPNGLKWYV